MRGIALTLILRRLQNVHPVRDLRWVRRKALLTLLLMEGYLLLLTMLYRAGVVRV